MNREFLKSLMLREMEESIRLLRDSIKTRSMFDVVYFEGGLNKVINLYQLLFTDAVPEALWKQVIETWDLVTEREEKENK